MILTTACGKKYSDYPNVWVSKDECVRIDPGGIAYINYDGIDSKRNINVLSDSGRQYLRFCYGKVGDSDTSEYVWEAEADIKNDKMYLFLRTCVSRESSQANSLFLNKFVIIPCN